jgi:exopolyphosphatase/guanosine-5'-triphosphate,3'-diphosphate pyrophosphatase
MVAARRDESVPNSLNQLSFSREEFAPLYRDLIQSTSSERKSMKGLDSKRVELIVAGAEFLNTAMELFEVDGLTISEWALREGMVLEAVGRHDPVDLTDDPRAIRRASIQALARRFSWPESHSRHVAKLSLDLFDQLRELHGLGDDDRELLEYAALLHDIGEHVSHDGHDRHAAYLVAHGQLRGFDPEEILLLTALVRWHRRGDPKSADDLVGDLDDAQRDRVRRLASLLRIADGLDRSRNQVIPGLAARVGPSLVLLRLQTNGQDPELELWGARRKRELFEKTFDRELELTAHPSG